jgi:lysophospholipase L1-like esterase
MVMIKIACIGDSLTYGYLVDDREVNCYPTVLNDLLGDDYVVGNFGVNGHTMLKISDNPYWEHENFKLSTMFEPDIVIIMLGSNDSKPHNFTTMDVYLSDYEAMIDHYRGLVTKPRIYLATPPTVFPHLQSADSTIRAEVVEQMAEAVLELGKKLHISVIPVNQKTKDFPDGFDIDGVHTNISGAKLIAETVYRELTKK